MSQIPEQFRIEPEENAQHAGQIHLGDILFREGADELVQVFIGKLDEELLELEAPGDGLADVFPPAVLVLFQSLPG